MKTLIEKREVVLENLGDIHPLALFTAMAFRTRAEKQRRMQDPEYKAKAEAREQEKAEAQYTSLYNEAHAANEEYERAPRAFMRRLRKDTHAE